MGGRVFAAADGADIVFAFWFVGTRHKVCVPTVMDGALEDMRGVGGVKKSGCICGNGSVGKKIGAAATTKGSDRPMRMFGLWEGR